VLPSEGLEIRARAGWVGSDVGHRIIVPGRRAALGPRHRHPHQGPRRSERAAVFHFALGSKMTSSRASADRHTGPPVVPLATAVCCQCPSAPREGTGSHRRLPVSGGLPRLHWQHTSAASGTATGPRPRDGGTGSRRLLPVSADTGCGARGRFRASREGSSCQRAAAGPEGPPTRRHSTTSNRTGGPPVPWRPGCGGCSRAWHGWHGCSGGSGHGRPLPATAGTEPGSGPPPAGYRAGGYIATSGA